jgi:hypothetical protein
VDGTGPSSAFAGLERVTIIPGKQWLAGIPTGQPPGLGVLTENKIVAVVWPGANVTVPELGLNAAASPMKYVS